MALPTTGITTTLVAQTIGEASNDVGTLCSSTKINKWSKWKPIRYSKSSGLIVSEFFGAGNNWGVIKPAARVGGTGGDYDVKNAIINAATLDLWTHDKPTGTYISPYRLGDFRNYNHSAIPFIYLPLYINNTITVKVSESSKMVKANPLTDVGDTNYNITFSDVFDYTRDSKNYRLAAVLTAANKGAIQGFGYSPFLMDSLGNLITDNLWVQIDVYNTPPATNYELYIALQEQNTYNFYPLPKDSRYNIFPVKVNVDQSGVYDGINIATPATDVGFTYPYDFETKAANQCTVEYGNIWTLMTNNGDVIVKMKFKNDYTSPITLTLDKIRLYVTSGSVVRTVYATAFDTLPLDGSAQTPTEIILNGSTYREVYFLFSAALINTVNPYLIIEYKVNNFTWRDLWKATLNYQVGDNQWI